MSYLFPLGPDLQDSTALYPFSMVCIAKSTCYIAANFQNLVARGPTHLTTVKHYIPFASEMILGSSTRPHHISPSDEHFANSNFLSFWWLYILYVYIILYIHNIRSRVSVDTAGCCWGRFIRLCRLLAINPRSLLILARTCCCSKF
jgi:hypothetical protein